MVTPSISLTALSCPNWSHLAAGHLTCYHAVTRYNKKGRWRPDCNLILTISISFISPYGDVWGFRNALCNPVWLITSVSRFCRSILPVFERSSPSTSLSPPRLIHTLNPSDESWSAAVSHLSSLIKQSIHRLRDPPLSLALFQSICHYNFLLLCASCGTLSSLRLCHSLYFVQRHHHYSASVCCRYDQGGGEAEGGSREEIRRERVQWGPSEKTCCKSDLQERSSCNQLW